MEKETLYAQTRPYVRQRVVLAILVGLGLGGFLLFIGWVATSSSWLMGICFGLVGTAILLLAFVQAVRMWRQPVLLVTAVITQKREIRYGGPGGGGRNYYLALHSSEIIEVSANGQESTRPLAERTQEYRTEPLVYSLVTEGQQVQLLCTTIPKRVAALWDEDE